MDTKGSQGSMLPTTNLAAIPIEEDTLYYAAIKGSLHANDCSVFGLGQEEVKALTKKFPGSWLEVVNGFTVKANVLVTLNSLAQLGYKIVSSTGETEITWTLQHMDHKECEHVNCAHTANRSVCQTLSEMDWERGLWNAAYNGDKERVQSLIDKAKNIKETVNAPDNSGYTALHYAARCGNVEICKMLLNNGANINAQTSGKATPLLKAAAAGKIATVKFLIQSGADIEMEDVDGETVLHKAAGNRNLEVINFLLEMYPQLAYKKDAKGQVAAIEQRNN